MRAQSIPDVRRISNRVVSHQKTDGKGNDLQKLRWTLRIQFIAPFRRENPERDYEKGRAGFRVRVDRRREERIKRCN